MVDTPERIWASSVTENYGEWQTATDGLPRPTEYIRADLAALSSAAVAEREPVAWLPTATIEWLEEYDGPACGTKTVAHNRPIKSDSGIPVYLDPSPVSELEAENARLRDRMTEMDKALERLIEAADSASWVANIGTMDNAIEVARRVREGGKVDG